MPRYYGLGPMIVNDVVIGVEKIAECRDDIRTLHELHWAETETKYRSEQIEPNYDSYAAYEKADQFVLVTARHRGQMVGYLMYILHNSLHSRTKEAYEDAFFLRADYRGQGLASEMIQFAEDVCREVGVTHIGMSDKSPCGGPSLAKLMAKHGYKPVAVYYHKELDHVLQQAARSA